MGAFGATGGKPVWTPPDNGSAIVMGSGNIADQVMVHDIRFEGDWDPATETGDRGQTPFTTTSHAAANLHFVVYNCEFDGLARIYLAGEIGATVQKTWAMVDCDITNWSDYGVFSSIGIPNYDPERRLAIVGCAIHQNPDACVNAQGKDGLGNDHGPVPLGGCHECDRLDL